MQIEDAILTASKSLSGAYSPGLIEAVSPSPPAQGVMHLSGAYSPGLIEASLSVSLNPSVDGLSGAYSPGLIEAQQGCSSSEPGSL